MADTRKGYIMTIKRAPHGGGPEGNTNVEFYDFIRRDTEKPVPGGEPSLHIKLNMDKIGPGGGVEEHYHEEPIVDHVYYVISGKVLATCGDLQEVVGPDTVICCPSSVKHSVTNVGKTAAKVISIDACGKGVKGGDLVYSKMPSGDLSGKTWKVAKK
jgi:mannose-6-phosphate isomerase-like protein (cupin superfamily)